MASEWPCVPFAQLLAEPVRNGLYKPKEYHGRGAKIVNMKELFAFPRLRTIPMQKILLSASEEDRFGLIKGDLLFARRSLVAEGAGKCSVVLEVDEPTTFESSIIRARPDSNKADPLFLYYFFNSTRGLQCLDTIRRQVAVAGITGSDLSRLEIPIPPLSEQRAIAQILGTLDDKIELTRQMNETLEAMARALFKSWFVDFDPVRAKMDGRWRRGESLPGLPASLYDIFPDQLVDSELGEIPEGWRVGTLGAIGKNPRRTVHPNEIASGKPYISLENMPQRCIALSDWRTNGGPKSNKSAFYYGEILFGKLRPYFHKVGIAPIDGVCSTDIIVIAPIDKEWVPFILGHVSSDRFVGYTSAGSTGTKMPRTSWAEMSRYEIVVPLNNVRTAFCNLVQPVINRIITGIHESRTLAVFRDALLPKLISGDLRVKDAAKAVKCVT